MDGGRVRCNRNAGGRTGVALVQVDVKGGDGPAVIARQHILDLEGRDAHDYVFPGDIFHQKLAYHGAEGARAVAFVDPVASEVLFFVSRPDKKQALAFLGPDGGGGEKEGEDKKKEQVDGK